MARVKGSAVTGAVVITAATLKTVAQLVAAANHRVAVTELEISFNGTTNTNEPVRVDVVRQTDAGTSTALTPVKRGDFGETLQTTARHTATVEPTTTDVIKSFLVHPQQGWAWQARLDDPIDVPGGTRLGVRVLAPAGVSAVTRLEFEE